MASLPIEIAQLPTADAVSSSTRLLVQNGVAGTPYEQTTLGAALTDLLDEIGSGTVVAGSVLITSGTATLENLTATIAALGTVTISGGTGTLATGAIQTLTVGGTATIGTAAVTVLNAGTVDISGGKASLTSGTISTVTTGSLIATAGTIGNLNAGTVAIAGGTGTLSAATVSGTATVGHLAATTGSVATLTTAGTATVGHVAATTAAIGTATISAGTATLSAGTITDVAAVTLAATGVATIGTLMANAGTVTLAKATITDLAAPTITTSGTVTAEHVASKTAAIATLTGTTVNAGTVAVSGVLTAPSGTITNATAPTLTVGGTATVAHLAATTAAIAGGTATLSAGTITSVSAVTLAATGVSTLGTLIANAGTVTLAKGTITDLAATTLAASGTATVGHLAGTTGVINTGTVSALTSTTINAGTVTVGNVLTAPAGTVTALSAPTLAVSGTATVGHVAAATGAIATLTGTSATIGTIAATVGTVAALTGTTANVGTVTVGNTLTAPAATITSAAASTLAVSGTATVGHVIGTTGAIGTLTGTVGTFGTLTGTVTNATTLIATGGTATALTIGTATINAGTAALSSGTITAATASTLTVSGVSTHGTLIASAGTATLAKATITSLGATTATAGTLVAGGATTITDARYLFPEADLDANAAGVRATDINGGAHYPAVTTDILTVGTIAGAAAFEAFAVSSGTIAGDVYATDPRYLFPSVSLDDDGAGYAAEDITGGQHFGAITAPEATIPALNGTVTAGGLITASATIAGGAIVADTRHLFVDAVTDADGAGMLAIDAAGNLHVNRLTGASLRMTADPTDADDVVRFSYFQANAGGSASSYLEPSVYADAPIDGVTDASTGVDTTITAIIAAGDRKMAVDYTYQVGSLPDNDIDNVIPIGPGTLVGDDHYKSHVPPYDAPGLPPPRRSLVVRRDLPTYAAAVRANAGPITVVITGDSTSGRNVAGMNFMSSPYSTITEYLQAAAPGVVFNFLMRGIGGTTLAELDTVPDWDGATLPVWYDPDDTTPWLDVIEADSPVLVVVHGGRNQNDDFAVATAQSIADKIVAMGADALFINSYGEVPITSDAARNDRLAAGLFLHAFASTYGPGVGSIDTLSYENLARFGWDPSNLAPMRSGGWFADGVMPTSITDLPLPYTCPTAAHGWSFSCRIPAGKWTTMGNRMWFRIGNEHNAENLGQRLELERDSGTNMVSWRITITTTEAGGPTDWDFTAWTETGITVTDSDLVKFDVGQMGNRIVLMWRDGGSPTTLADLSYSPVDIRVPRAGGAYQMTIGCAAGSVTGCVYMSTGTDGKSSGALAIPIKQQLYMPVLTGAEFAPPANTDFAVWGGNGPHPSALVWQYVTDPVFNAQDWSAS